MGDHELATSTPTSLPIYRPWTKIDPKVLIGAVSSLTVGGVVSAAALFGLVLPTWGAALIVIAAYAIAAYWTKTRIPVAPDSGLTPQMAEGATAAVDASVELADGDLRDALADAFRAGGHVLDDDGRVVGADPDALPDSR